MGASNDLRVNPTAAELRRYGGIMRGRRADYHMPGFRGPLSIKTMIRGRGHWRTVEGEFAVVPGQLLVLNPDRHYTLTLDPQPALETFCPFFAPALVAAAWAERVASDERLLDHGTELPALALPGFVETLRRPTPALLRSLQRLAVFSDTPTGLAGEATDEMLGLLNALFDVLELERVRIGQLPAARPATREELHRRICRARDHVHAKLDAELSLATLAKVAAMSTCHFHRWFRAVVGMTPARYISEQRLLEARRLLEHGREPVTEICLRVGFASLGSFSSAIRRRFGASPSELRARTR